MPRITRDIMHMHGELQYAVWRGGRSSPQRCGQRMQRCAGRTLGSRRNRVRLVRWRANATTLKELIGLTALRCRPRCPPAQRRSRPCLCTTIGATPRRPANYASGLDIKYRRNRTGRGPRCVRAIAFDRPRHPLPVAWNSPVADIARPRINDVGGSVHIPGVAGTGDDSVFALEILRGRILVPSPGPRAGEAGCKRCRTDDASDFHGHIPQFLAEIGGAEIAGKAGPLRIMCPYGPWILPPLVM